MRGAASVCACGSLDIETLFNVWEQQGDCVSVRFGEIKASTFVGFCLCDEELAIIVEYNNNLMILLVFDGILSLRLSRSHVFLN